MSSENAIVIKQLSKFGEVIRTIECHPGELTVLRANEDGDLLPFRQTLFGQNSGHKFTLTLNDNPFHPHSAALIGFGNNLRTEQTPIDYIKGNGGSEEQIIALLRNFGLEDYLQTPITTLSDCAKTRLQILYAVTSKMQVFILDSPFERITSEWKERFADLIMDTTVNQKRITIVTRLSYRPQRWVGNKDVQRVANCRVAASTTRWQR